MTSKGVEYRCDECSEEWYEDDVHACRHDDDPKVKCDGIARVVRTFL